MQNIRYKIEEITKPHSTSPAKNAFVWVKTIKYRQLMYYFPTQRKFSCRLELTWA